MTSRRVLSGQGRPVMRTMASVALLLAASGGAAQVLANEVVVDAIESCCICDLHSAVQ